MANPINKKKLLLVLIVTIGPVILSLRKQPPDATTSYQDFDFSFFLQKDTTHFPDPDPYPMAHTSDLQYDFYRSSCPQAESIVKSRMASFYSNRTDVSANLLRLFFHDCFIQGCDASVLLDDSNAKANHSAEKQALPNHTLKGLDKIDMIKEELEGACPGVVSCADTLALATREGILLDGGPYYPVFTGRRDSSQSYFKEAEAEIPKPTEDINRILKLFSLRGFNERETVALLGGHNVGKIGCNFIQVRLDNFQGTGNPDPTMPLDFLNEMRLKCQDKNITTNVGAPVPITPPGAKKSSCKDTMDSQQLLTSIASGKVYDSHYYRNLLRGRGLLFSDQQLMADVSTERYVRHYASDDGRTFRKDFSRAMLRLSNLNVLTGSQGQVRTKCSLPVTSS